MVPDHITADAAGSRPPISVPRPVSAQSGCVGASGETVARVNRLVAAIKAERGMESATQRTAETGERAELVELLRRFVAARERERLAWEEATSRLEGELVEVKAAAQAAQEQAATRHQRMLADLELLHEHQRSIWQLERRRFEISVAALERTLRRRATRGKAQLALIASLFVVAMIGFGVTGDNDPAAMASKWRERFEAVRQLPLPPLFGQGGLLAVR